MFLFWLRGQGTGRWHTRGGRVVGGDRRIPSYSGDYRYAREDKDVEVQLLLFSAVRRVREGGLRPGQGQASGVAATLVARPMPAVRR